MIIYLVYICLLYIIYNNLKNYNLTKNFLFKKNIFNIDNDINDLCNDIDDVNDIALNDDNINILYISLLKTGENHFYNKIKEIYIKYDDFSKNNTENNMSYFNKELINNNCEYINDNLNELDLFLNHYIKSNEILYIIGYDNDINFMKNYIKSQCNLYINDNKNIFYIDLKTLAKYIIKPVEKENCTGWWSVSNENKSFYDIDELSEYLDLNGYQNVELIEKLFLKLYEDFKNTNDNSNLNFLHSLI